MKFKEWYLYFESHQHHFDHIDWNDEIELDGFEEALITPSLQQFQKGESSDGLHLLSLAEQMNDWDYAVAMHGLIKEEQKHASVLEKFMKKERIQTIESHWLDTIFKKIIKSSSFELTIIVLTTAEIIATVFYDALSKATYSKTLKAICAQILQDEAMHLNFQATALNTIYERHNLLGKFLSRVFHFSAFTFVMLFIWLQYRSVFKAGGFQFKRYLGALLAEFFRVEQMISGFSPIPIPVTNKISSYAS